MPTHPFLSFFLYVLTSVEDGVGYTSANAGAGGGVNKRGEWLRNSIQVKGRG